MCDNDSMDDMIEYRLKSAALSRREFGALTVGAGVASVLSPVANAAEVKGSDVDIKTPDGTCDAYFVHPAKGKGAGVLVWPDIFGLRPAFKKMADRLAESGYSVLVINPFYRAKHAPTAPRSRISTIRRRARRCLRWPAASMCRRRRRTRRPSSAGSTVRRPSIRSGRSVRRATAWAAP